MFPLDYSRRAAAIRIVKPPEDNSAPPSEQHLSGADKEAFKLKLLKDLKAGGVLALQEFQDEGADLNAVIRGFVYRHNYDSLSSDPGTPLHWASYFKNSGAMELLITSGVDVEARDFSGNTALLWACSAENGDGVRCLVAAGANVEVIGSGSMTPLHWASMKGEEGMVQCLLEAGANIDPMDEEKKTPLHHAVRRNRAEAVRVLLAAGASLEVADCNGETPLHCASMTGKAEAVQILAEAGANLEASDNKGKTPLHCAVGFRGSSDGVAVKCLVDCGANVDVVDRSGQTPLHRALYRSSWDDVRVLVEAGASLEIGDRQGKTPLHYTARNGSEDAARVVVEAGAPIDAVDGCGRTTLHSAVVNRALAVARYLAEVGASPQTAEESGETPLHCAAFYADRDLAEAFVKAGANVQAVNEDGQTPLHCAAESGEEFIAQLLVDAGADVDARDGDGRTPLHWATECGKDQVVAVLIKANADSQLKDDEGRSPSHLSVACNDPTIVDLLARRMADGDAASKDGSGASPNPTSVQQARSLEHSTASGADKLSEGLHHDSSQFDTAPTEVNIRFNLREFGGVSASYDDTSTSRDFLKETDDFIAVLSDHDAPAKEKPKNPSDAIQKLSVRSLVANKYRISSRRIACKGYMRSAVDVETQRPVSLKFYEERELMNEHARILEGYKQFSWACRLVETIGRDGMLPGCIVLEGSLLPLKDWLRVCKPSTENKLEMLRSFAVALEGLHGQGLVHLNICPESVVFCTKDRTCKFLYLNRATSVDKQSKTQWPSHYAAPEMQCTDCEPFHVPYQAAADMWAYGVIAYELLARDTIYDRVRDRDYQFFAELEGNRFRQKLNSVKDKRHAHFIRKFLKLDPKKRQTASAAGKSSLLLEGTGAGTGDAVNS